MSFSFEKNFKNVAAAQAALSAPDGDGPDTHNAKVIPQGIRSFMLAGLANLPESLADHPVRVKAVGHLCDGRGSYTISSADVVVQPIEVHG